MIIYQLLLGRMVYSFYLTNSDMLFEENKNMVFWKFISDRKRKHCEVGFY